LAAATNVASPPQDFGRLTAAGCFWPLPRLHSVASAAAVGVGLARFQLSHMLLASPLTTGDAMTDIDTTQIKQQAFGASKPTATEATETHKAVNALGTSSRDDLTGTDEGIDGLTGAPDEPSKGRRKLTKPKRTVEEAIEDGRSLAEIEALQEEWNAYNRQEALRKISQEKKALAERIEAGRRKFADQLLAIADEYGVTIAEARDIFRAALKRKFPNGVKGQ